MSKAQARQQQEYFENLYLKKTNTVKPQVPPAIDEFEHLVLPQPEEAILEQEPDEPTPGEEIQTNELQDADLEEVLETMPKPPTETMPMVSYNVSTSTQTDRVYSCYLHSYQCDVAKNENDYEKGVSIYYHD